MRRGASLRLPAKPRRVGTFPDGGMPRREQSETGPGGGALRSEENLSKTMMNQLGRPHNQVSKDEMGEKNKKAYNEKPRILQQKMYKVLKQVDGAICILSMKSVCPSKGHVSGCVLILIN